MFSVHTTLEEFKNVTITGHFGKGVAGGGGSWGARDSPFLSLFKQTTYNR